MKNKFLLIMFIVMLGVISTSKADVDLGKINIIDKEIVDRGLLCGEREEIIVPINLSEHNCKVEYSQNIKCTECNRSVNNLPIPLKIAFEGNKSTVSVKINCKAISQSECAGQYTDNSIKLTDLGYKEVEVDKGKKFYVHPDELEKVMPTGKERVMFSFDGTDLYLVYFDPAEVDLYSEGEYKTDDDENYFPGKKHGIYPFFTEVNVSDVSLPDNANRHEYNKKSYISMKDKGSQRIFFVCTAHATCKAGCKNFVASKGNEDLDSGNYLNIYCAQDHACGFFWDATWETGRGRFSEGLECCPTVNDKYSKRKEGSLFCDMHTCLECNNPIIGVSMVYEKPNNTNLYYGTERSYYSDYCADHFCEHYGCRKGRINSNSNGSETDSTEGNKVNNPIFCEEHNSICAVPGCTKKLSANSKSVFCKDHQGSVGQTECALCNVNVASTETRHLTDDENTRFCLACVETIFRAKEKGVSYIFYGDFKNVKARDLKYPEGYISILGERTLTKCDLCKHTEYDVITVNGYTLCPKCANDIKSGAIGAIVDTSGKTIVSSNDIPEGLLANSQDATTPNNTNANGYYYGGGGYSSGGAPYQPPTVPAVTECIHSNYPVPNTVRFTNVTETTHVQEWVCSNCNGEQKITYEHMYINKVCVCGNIQDSDAPTLEVIYPSDIKSVKAGSEIRVKLTDNRSLKSIKYICFWGDDKAPVTKELSGGEVEELLVGELPTELGKYTLFILEVVDSSGNKLEDQSYIFEVKDIEDESGDEDEQKPSSSDKTEPKIKIGLATQLDADIKDDTTIRVQLDKDKSKVNLILSDNKSLSKIIYSCLWEEDPSFKEKSLDNKSNYTLKIDDIPQGDESILVISELQDKAGNKLENVTIVFVTEEDEADTEVDTVKPTIELVSPQNLSEVRPGSNIKIKFSDNKELDTVVYKIITKEKGSDVENSKDKQYICRGALSQELEIATLENNTTIVTIELKLKDVAGNETNASYTFTVNEAGVVEVQGGGEAGYFVDDSEYKDSKNAVEYNDDTVPEPIA